MDRITLDEKVVVGKEVLMKGPPLEAFVFKGAVWMPGHLDRR